MRQGDTPKSVKESRLKCGSIDGVTIAVLALPSAVFWNDAIQRCATPGDPISIASDEIWVAVVTLDLHCCIFFCLLMM